MTGIVLVHLDAIDVAMLETMVTNAWRLRAPKSLLTRVDAAAQDV